MAQVRSEAVNFVMNKTLVSNNKQITPFEACLFVVFDG
jgi:hypothetical protein